MKKLLIFTLCLAATLAFGATVGTDTAANYASGGFTNGANQGTGFQAWNIFADGNGGTFLGDSTDGNCGDINTSNQSFGMWGNPSGGNYINCYRQFAGGALSMGQSFSVKIGVNYRNGNKGLDLLADGVSVYNLNVGSDDYVYEDKINGSDPVSFGWNYAAASIIEVKVTQGNAGVLTQAVVEVTRYTNSVSAQSVANSTDSQTFTFTGAIDEFKLYCGDTGEGASENNFYANDLTIVPEPASVGLAAVLLGFLAWKRR